MNEPQRIRIAGWRQGSVIERQRASEAFKAIVKDSPGDLTHFVVLTQDCDLIHESYENEPSVELLGCKVAAAPNGNYMYGKNPRRIHLEANIAEKKATLEGQVSQRHTLPRGLLEEFAPSVECQLPTASIHTLIDWVARRYTRSAFPDEFNRRIRKAQGGIAKVLKDHGNVISSVWILLNSTAELKPGEAYKVRVRIVMAPDDYAVPQKRDVGMRVVDALEIGLTNCDGITVERVDLVSEDDFPLSDLRYLMQFDAYDHLSNVD